MKGECRTNNGKHSFTLFDTAEPHLILCKDNIFYPYICSYVSFFVVRNAWRNACKTQSAYCIQRGNEYLCNKDSKKSLHFFLSKQKTKTVPSSPSHRQIMHLHTLRTAIKPTPADIPHITVMPVPPSRTTEKHFPHHKKALFTPQESPYCDTEKALPQHGRYRLATQKHTFLWLSAPYPNRAKPAYSRPLCSYDENILLSRSCRWINMHLRPRLCIFIQK